MFQNRNKTGDARYLPDSENNNYKSLLSMEKHQSDGTRGSKTLLQQCKSGLDELHLPSRLSSAGNSIPDPQGISEHSFSTFESSIDELEIFKDCSDEDGFWVCSQEEQSKPEMDTPAETTGLQFSFDEHVSCYMSTLDDIPGAQFDIQLQTVQFNTDEPIQQAEPSKPVDKRNSKSRRSLSSERLSSVSWHEQSKSPCLLVARPRDLPRPPRNRGGLATRTHHNLSRSCSFLHFESFKKEKMAQHVMNVLKTPPSGRPNLQSSLTKAESCRALLCDDSNMQKVESKILNIDDVLHQRSRSSKIPSKENKPMGLDKPKRGSAGLLLSRASSSRSLKNAGGSIRDLDEHISNNISWLKEQGGAVNSPPPSSRVRYGRSFSAKRLMSPKNGDREALLPHSKH